MLQAPRPRARPQARTRIRTGQTGKGRDSAEMQAEREVTGKQNTRPNGSEAECAIETAEDATRRGGERDADELIWSCNVQYCIVVVMSITKQDYEPMAVAVADKGVPMVEVSAPSDLPGGYVFDAVANGQTFSVTVPAGGVSRGQTFSAPLVPGGRGVSASAVPEGRWKDGLCGCCMFGCCHPALWMGIPARASPEPLEVELARLLQGFIDPSTGLPMEGSPYWAIYAVNQVFSFAVIVFTIYVILKTRRYIRESSGIPEKSCQGCEDCCCATWCGCCTVMQMARHTAEYETYAGQCCSETGLPVSAPQLQFGGAHIV
ncbi:hypothetical protein THAOC_12085 [Thalassiosira oceanica]|uniref:PLAC8 family protein n=1 Tax=Thalassiosira oceanica TaxID=159749 RepID=K0T8T4_THAOC|nr:hypothetical protein THAOC_12085 [Thalassiosira oceanica]|eukprot:EJK66942.1 hypothetical protein THAOC_12085 [Thalassiosira oceanica]